MSKHCRFCGGKIASDTVTCPHCGKQLIQIDKEDGSRLTNLDSWEGRSVPAWVMYLVVAFFLFCFVAMFVEGCREEPPKPKSPTTASMMGDGAEWGSESVLLIRRIQS